MKSSNDRRSSSWFNGQAIDSGMSKLSTRSFLWVVGGILVLGLISFLLVAGGLIPMPYRGVAIGSGAGECRIVEGWAPAQRIVQDSINPPESGWKVYAATTYGGSVSLITTPNGDCSLDGLSDCCLSLSFPVPDQP